MEQEPLDVAHHSIVIGTVAVSTQPYEFVLKVEGVPEIRKIMTHEEYEFFYKFLRSAINDSNIEGVVIGE